MAAAVDGGRQRSSRDAWLVTGLRVCLLRAGPRERCEHFQDGVKGRLFLRGDLPATEALYADEESETECIEEGLCRIRKLWTPVHGRGSVPMRVNVSHDWVKVLLAAGHLKSAMELADRMPRQWIPGWYVTTWSRMCLSLASALATVIANGHFGLAEWCLSSQRMQRLVNPAHTFVWARSADPIRGGDPTTAPSCAVLCVCVQADWQWGIERIWHLGGRRLAAVSMRSAEDAERERRYFRLAAVHAAACAGSLHHMERFAHRELAGVCGDSFVCPAGLVNSLLGYTVQSAPLSAIEWLYHRVESEHKLTAISTVRRSVLVRKNDLPLLEWVERQHGRFVVKAHTLVEAVRSSSPAVLRWLTHPHRLARQSLNATRAVQYACTLGNITALEYLWSEEWRPYWHSDVLSNPREVNVLFNRASHAGSFACVEFLRNHGCMPSRWGQCLVSACEKDTADPRLLRLMVRLVEVNGLDEDEDVRRADICAAACAAARNSQLSVLLLLPHAIISVQSAGVVKHALQSRAWSTAFWLLRHGFASPDPLAYDLAVLVAQGGHRGLVQFVLTRLAAQENKGMAPLLNTSPIYQRMLLPREAPPRVTVKSLTTFAMRTAARLRDMRLVQWLWENCPSQAATRAVLFSAAENGALAIMEWCFARARGSEAPAFFLQSLLCESAKKGQLHVVQWLCERHGTAIAEEQEHALCKPAQLAAKLGHLRVVEWLCSPQRQLPAAATCCADEILFEACPRSLDVVEFCCERLGCAVTSRHLSHATQHGTPASLSVGEIERYLVARASLTARVVSAATQWLPFR